MKLPPPVATVFARVDAMSLRERAMVAATVLAVLWAAWDGLLMQPLNGLEAARKEQLGSVTAQVSELNNSIQSLAQAGSGGGNERRRLAELRARGLELDGELRDVTRELVAPDEMTALLESVLEKTGSLRLVGMETLPAEPIVAEGHETGFYRHGLAVEVRGSYLDTLRYLQVLETLPWRFLWESVELEVTVHPTSAVRIVVYTLGQRAGVIGV